MAKKKQATAEALEWTGESRDAFHAKLAEGDVAGALAALESYPGVRRKDFAPQDKAAMAAMNKALAADAEKQRALAFCLVSPHAGVRLGCAYVCSKLTAFDSENLLPAMQAFFPQLERESIERFDLMTATSHPEMANWFTTAPDPLKQLLTKAAYTGSRAQRDAMFHFHELIERFPPSGNGIGSFFEGLPPKLAESFRDEVRRRAAKTERREDQERHRSGVAKAPEAAESMAAAAWSSDAARQCLRVLQTEGADAALEFAKRFPAIATNEFAKIPVAAATEIADSMVVDGRTRTRFLDALMSDNPVECLAARWIAASLPHFPVAELIQRGCEEIVRRRPDRTAYPCIEDAFKAMAPLLDAEAILLLANCPPELRSDGGNARNAAMRAHGASMEWEDARRKATEYATLLDEATARDMLGAMVWSARQANPVLSHIDPDLPFLRHRPTFEEGMDRACREIERDKHYRAKKDLQPDDLVAEWKSLLADKVVGSSHADLNGAVVYLALLREADRRLGTEHLRGAVAMLIGALSGRDLPEKLDAERIWGDRNSDVWYFVLSFASDDELEAMLARKEVFWGQDEAALRIADSRPAVVRKYLERWKRSYWTFRAFLDHPAFADVVADRLAACLQSEDVSDHEWAWGIVYARPERLAPSGEDYLDLTARFIFAARKRPDVWNAVERVAFVGRGGRAPKDRVFAALEEVFQLDDPTAWRKAADAMREFRKELPHLALANRDRVRELVARDPKKHGAIFKGLVEE